MSQTISKDFYVWTKTKPNNGRKTTLEDFAQNFVQSPTISQLDQID